MRAIGVLSTALAAVASGTAGEGRPYRITVPITNADLADFGGREKMLAELRKLDAERVLLACGEYRTDPARRAEQMRNVRENAAFFRANGLEVGVWNWTFLFEGAHGFVSPQASDGAVIKDFACALDPAFRKFAAEYYADYARCGVDLILFDDDFCYGTRNRDALVCTCPLHMERLRRILGEDLTPTNLQVKAMTGGRNRYRDAWRQANREALVGFAREMRAAVDAVNPKVRMGVCAVMSLWDDDGVDAATLSRLLAGKGNRPYLRLIGAPYWAVNRSFYDCRLQTVVEMERAERSWCGDDIEIVGEGDAYPRPRSQCPASYLELFDLAMRADGRMDGLMKYAIDYHSPLGYETGYVDRHMRNKPLYAAVERAFADKPAVGVRVVHARDKIADVVVPKEYEGTSTVLAMFSSAAGRMLSDAGIPTVYDGEGMCTAAFGEDVRYVPAADYAKGVVIDAWAAQILTEQGVDVGVRTFGEKVRVDRERFEGGRLTARIPRMFARRLTPDAGATVESWFVIGAKDRFPASFTYENAAGGKFLVLCYDGYFNGYGKGRCSARSRQLERGIFRISGRKVPAYAYGNPDLYVMAKRKDGAMAVGLWNMFADDVSEPVVELDGPYREIEFINCTGKLEGDRVRLSAIPPFAFAGFVVR